MVLPFRGEHSQKSAHVPRTVPGFCLEIMLPQRLVPAVFLGWIFLYHAVRIR